MSVNYSNNKKNPSGMYPNKVTKASGEGAAGFSRVEPWITPERMRNEFLFGIPLVSPLTKQELSDDTIKSIIRRSAAKLELKCKIDVTPIQRFEKLEFDRTKYLQGWNQLQLNHGNINSLQEVGIRAVNSQPQTIVSIAAAPTGIVAVSGVITVTCNGVHNLLSNMQVTINDSLNASFNGTFTVTSTPTASTFTFNLAIADTTSGGGFVTANGDEGTLLYAVPLDWIDMNQAHKGLLHFVPLQTTFGSYGVSGPSAGAAAPLFAIFSQLQWVPSFWSVRYTCGFDENSIPSTINDLIGAYAAMEILSMLGPLLRYNSQSISLDGASQSTSGPGNQLYVVRYQQLQEKAADLEDLIQSRFGKRIFMSHI